MEILDHILIFKTNCTDLKDKKVVRSLLESELGVEEWNLDQEDCDCVLRVISHELRHDHIIQLMNDYGYECHELN